MNRILNLLVINFCLILMLPLNAQSEEDKPDKPPSFSLMGFGDSITEGGAAFSSYLFPLWEKLLRAGYIVDFVGPRQAPTRIGVLNHAGYSGRTAEFLEGQIDSIYRKYPADVVLLHAGHNHFAEEQPVSGILDAQRSIISRIKKINPDALILVARVIESGKLPKYSYIPKLNAGIGELVKELRQNCPGIYLVDQSASFHWETDAIQDKVHPNSQGAEKMAETWFRELEKHLKRPSVSFSPELVVYKKAGDARLKLHIFQPEEPHREDRPRPCILFFFGGGWKYGTPLQFYREAAHYAGKGMVAISADYRIGSANGSTVFESVADARSAIRWVREHAQEYHIDPGRIAVAGASAGGHLAAATGTLAGFDEEGERRDISAVPDLNILYYPVLDNGPDGYGSAEVKTRFKEISPMHNVGPQTPSTLILLGTEDPYLSETQARKYKARLEQFGTPCKLMMYPGSGHPVFHYRKGPSSRYYEMLRDTDRFLEEQGYLSP
ncbi:alpha/beta hydrolase fold domain-containing protein [Sinomicrobium weinanense]|uniref:Alpha/beta hydrolase fold domain-containing protein n=1 Tax=Sinomicrobium weinanense TaxID=2842200 RepID=A0A926Q335_9FLAO|nr:alpha/beta hydrolase fold domain-containing protein [Sinomicrobium weinanense]MBC9797153.1 alpha/beta hydrolase fold domain-containing protein [Sinomicrobium weinanense]MBU3124494.1 alpha/beta hydrolase fold domain-containing protein [Sinomicrobium weinanense]